MARRLDRRLVQTFLDFMMVMVMVMHRHRNQGLLLSELGGQVIEAWMWEQGDRKVEECMHPQDDTYVIWDESEIEKAESLKPERLCAVRSVKARRLKRIKKGYFNPPGGRPIFVPGFH